MFGAEKFRSFMRHPGMNGSDDAPPPPDTRPLADASVESARVMAQLGKEQLDFAKTQYEESKPFYADLVTQQKDISDQTAAQGKDYYDYGKSYRPAERALLDESLVDKSGEVAAYDAANQADAAALTQTDAALYDANRGEVDAGVGRAVADTENGYTRSLNQAMRQGLRYGASGSEVASQVGQIGLAQASMTAGAANAARTQGINDVRGRVANRLQLRQSNIGQKNAQEAVGWAKKLDAAGLVKGMPGASQGAYGLAVSAGNSSAGNRAAPGNAVQGALGQNASIVGQGRNLLQSGLGGVLNTQSSMYQPPTDQTGAIIGGVAGVAVAVI